MTDQEMGDAITDLQAELLKRAEDAEGILTLAEVVKCRDGDPGDPLAEPVIPPTPNLENVTEADVIISQDPTQGTWVILTFPKVLSTAGIEQKFWAGLVILFNESSSTLRTEMVDAATLRSPKGEAFDILQRLDSHLS